MFALFRPPDSPYGHPVFKMTVDNEVVLHWNPPLRDGGSEVYNYIVETKGIFVLLSASHEEMWSKFGTTHKTSLVLGHPDDIDGCTFRIRAKNIYGTGEASEELQFHQVHSSMKLDGESSESTPSFNATHQEETGTDLISNLENESQFSEKMDENAEPKIAINPNKIDNQYISSDYDISTCNNTFFIIKDIPDTNFDLLSSFKSCFEVVCEPNSAIIVSLPPQLLENSIFCDIHIPQKERCLTSFNCCKSISIILNCSLENFQYQDFSEKFLKSPEMIKFRSLSDEDFEGLVSICSTAVRTWKPAMSVLPIKRQVQAADFSQESHAPAEISNLYNQEISQDDSFDMKLNETISDVISQKVNLPAKSEEIILNYLESTFKTDQDIDQWANIDEIIMNQDSIPKNACDTSLNTLIEETHACSSTYMMKIPDWLSQVSPCDMSYKDYMAEEVERSFSDKAERIESLESILQGELFSLEKDLEAVNEIHRHLDDPYAFADSYTYDQFDEDLLLDISNPVEENLIEFTEDVPYVSQEQLKTDEYPPEVIVHLQNRVVKVAAARGCIVLLWEILIQKLYGRKIENPFKRVLDTFSEIWWNLVCTWTFLIRNPLTMASMHAWLQIAMVLHRHKATCKDREVSPEEPKFLKSPDDLSCHPGESVAMEWKITGTPMPHVMWFKNAAKIETNLRVDAFSNHRGCCRLVLHDVNADDSAIYSCYLENEAGSAVSTVLVSVADLKTEYKTPITCENQLLTNEELIPVEEQFYSSLLEETHYETKKKRKTSYGEKYFRAYKVHGDPPSSPLAVRVLNSGQTWTILTWSPPLEARSRFEYLIERRSLNSEHWIEVGRTYNTLYTVHGLKRGEVSV
ncbi:twitchin [Caerostris extrusa]|uniref:Twitchin n=1 Tax=Caerostris extrusa TaxID=172846 RepID=A0AAV4XTW6_CAEEX|nr:twitchin [Caerostris extrusa]